MIPEKIVFIGIFFNLMGQVFYIRSIFKGTTRPNLVTWFFWMLSPFIGFFYQVKAGATFSSFPIFMGGFGPLMVILASLFNKNSFWKIGKFDIYCGIIAAISLVLYILTHNLGISILFAILSDALGAIPTIIKSWKFPETESVAGYSWCILSNVLGLLVIKEWSFPIYSFGLYFIILNVGLTLILLRKKIFGTHELTQ